MDPYFGRFRFIVISGELVLDLEDLVGSSFDGQIGLAIEPNAGDDDGDNPNVLLEARRTSDDESHRRRRRHPGINSVD